MILSASETTDKPARSVEAREAPSLVGAVDAEDAPKQQEDQGECASGAICQPGEKLIEALEAPVHPVEAIEALMLVAAVDAEAALVEEDNRE